MLGPVLALLLPRLVVLRVLPAPIELVNLLLILRFYLCTQNITTNGKYKHFAYKEREAVGGNQSTILTMPLNLIKCPCPGIRNDLIKFSVRLAQSQFSDSSIN